MLDDRAVLATIAAGVAIVVFQLRKRGARGRRLFAAGWVAFFGLTLVVLMGAHSIDIVLHGIRTGSRLNGEPWRYDFQMYALHLLSAVLVWQGIRALRAAVTLADTGADVRGQAVRPVLITLAVVLPLIPIQAFFGTILTVLGGITLAVLIATPRNSM
jgi:hypothetical protein